MSPPQGNSADPPWSGPAAEPLTTLSLFLTARITVLLNELTSFPKQTMALSEGRVGIYFAH